MPPLSAVEWLASSELSALGQSGISPSPFRFLYPIVMSFKRKLTYILNSLASPERVEQKIFEN